MAEKSNKKAEPAATPKNNTAIAFMLAGAVAFGVGAGMMIESRNSSPDGGNAPTESQMAEFIAQNPKLILDSVRNYTAEMQRQEQEQGFNLVRANDGNTILGNPDGDVTIYEFSDYNCGYCKRSFNTLMALTAEDSDIRVVVKEFPILAQSSADAAILALGAGELGLFEAFHTKLMTWQGGLDDMAFETIAEDSGTTVADLLAAAEKIDTDAIISANRYMAEQLKITGTPAFLIGDTLIPGAISLDEMKALVKEVRENRKG